MQRASAELARPAHYRSPALSESRGTYEPFHKPKWYKVKQLPFFPKEKLLSVPRPPPKITSWAFSDTIGHILLMDAQDKLK